MPTNVEVYDEAIQLEQTGQIEAAVAKLQQLLQQDPQYALAHAALSVFYGKLGRYDEAVEHGRQVCQLEPEDPFSYVALSLICQKAGRLAEAEQAMFLARQAQVALYRSQMSQQE
ncbi:MAG TPA: tetratricopeptide repeat protein [Thermoguttaceae bacterium]|nr:tetratricopeptide repeat protein [Thermoguttaceae bacterium]HPP51367.1 tetratricopeptide repeat protein [Thermoguttaceae bacterium]